jgi:hypothetical protein
MVNKTAASASVNRNANVQATALLSEIPAAFPEKIRYSQHIPTRIPP